MNANHRVHLVEIPIGGRGGFVWNRLHGEREDICESLLKPFGPLAGASKDLLQARLRKVDDALDRLMSGSYGNCSQCGEAIDEAKLELDPVLSLCTECWATKSDPFTSVANVSAVSH